jgi:hypothetical protein
MISVSFDLIIPVAFQDRLKCPLAREIPDDGGGFANSVLVVTVSCEIDLSSLWRRRKAILTEELEKWKSKHHADTKLDPEDAARDGQDTLSRYFYALSLLACLIEDDDTTLEPQSPELRERLDSDLDFLPDGSRIVCRLNNDSAVGSDSEPELVKTVKKVLSQNKLESVKLCEEGVGGTYFIQDENEKNLAVFKPSDEEPGALNNPKDAISHPLLPPGGGANREVAAFLLDNGFAGVPETYFVRNIEHRFFSKNGINTPKSGSLQKFIDNLGDSESRGSSLFSVSEVHKIGILDIRLFNMDRNSENLLVVQNNTDPKPNYSLVPIDHTYILPPTLDSAWFEWQHWKQAKQPFSQDLLSYISSLDIEHDAKILQSIGIEPASIRTMKITTTLLQIAAKNGLNLFEIASMMTRKNRNQPSELEGIVSEAEERVKERLCDLGDAVVDRDHVFLEEITKIINEKISHKIKLT